MKTKEYKNLKIGAAVNYGPLKNVQYMGLAPCYTKPHVRMQDKAGKTMDVYESLFIKHAERVPIETEEPQKDCMFQYATAAKTFENTDLITMDEAKALWNQYKPQFIEDHGEGRNPEMVVWVDCEDDKGYGESLWHVDFDTVVIDGEIYIPATTDHNW